MTRECPTYSAIKHDEGITPGREKEWSAKDQEWEFAKLRNDQAEIINDKLKIRKD